MPFVPSTSYAQAPMREYTADYSEQPNKRQRTSISNPAETYVRDPTAYTSRPTYYSAQPAYDMYSAQAFTQATAYPTQAAITAPSTFPVRYNFAEAVTTSSPSNSSNLAYAMAPSTLPEQQQTALYQPSPQQQRPPRYYPSTTTAYGISTPTSSAYGMGTPTTTAYAIGTPTTTAYGMGTPQYTDISQIPPAPRMSHGQPNHFRSSNSTDSLQSSSAYALSSPTDSLSQQVQPIQPASNNSRRNAPHQGSGSGGGDYSQYPAQYHHQQQQQQQQQPVQHQHQHQQQINQSMRLPQTRTPNQNQLGLRSGDPGAGYPSMLPPPGSSTIVTTLDGSTGMAVTSAGFEYGNGGLGLEEG